MSQQRPVVIPKPNTEPTMQQNSDTIMGGVDLPKFSAEMQAEISPEAAPLWNFVTNHASKIATAVVSIVVIILAIAAWQWFVEQQVEKARTNMGRILSIQDAPRRVAELEKFMADAPSALKLSARLELAGAAAAAQDWKKAAEAYAEVAGLEGSSPLGFSARLNHAQILMRLGEYASARAEFTALAADAPREGSYIIHQQAAEAAEAAGDKAGAAALYEAALAALPPTDTQSMDFFRSRIAALKK
ncbi:MAG: tetratricopeptide repeat protein [Mailhella sp.]|nr:tetratricopeptide repeat protein [Mailhella sp.]